MTGIQLNTYTEPAQLLAEERQKTKFPVREMTYYLDGGKKQTEELERIMASIERNPAFSNDDQYDLDKDQQREITFARVGELTKMILHTMNEAEAMKRVALINLLDPSTGTRTGVHFGLFFNSIRGSGTDDQFGYWVDKGAGSLEKFFGCFSMTELGHGSNVAGLETTATYDKSTEEFVINTPHVGATKWWIGGAAHTATHTVCYARLIVDGKDYGVKQFVVQLRDSDHNLKPGIAIGDIGKKMGRDGIDNGWIQFTNVRIPRQYMLMKYSKVAPDGTVTEPPLNQLSYGALVGGRVSMVYDSVQTAKRFLTIALRYAAVRRQFSSTPGEKETRLIDYTYHQRRLIPLLAYTFAMRASAEEVMNFYIKTTKQLQAVDTSNKTSLQSAIDDAKELFALSAGMKAFSTWATAGIIDECRQACGGHGYSGYNGFGQGYNDWVVQCTWEGDNNVLTLSAGRSLILSGIDAREGKRVGDAVSYMSREKELHTRKLNGRSLTDSKVLIEAWECAAARNIGVGADAYLALIAKGLNQAQAFEELSQQRFECARIHTRLNQVHAFFQSIEHANEQLKPVLTDLATLFALWSIEKDGASFLSSGYLTTSELDEVTTLVDSYNHKIRDQVIGIVDSFNLSDFFINAPIGNYDGDVYKHYFEKVTRRNPPRDHKAPYHDKIDAFFNRAVPEDEDLSEMDV
ncbi:acyl-coenzyme A oxidase 2 [Trichomonascus vanleenenianus]|uniref:acyl-coenzyme A oxidase 2 n=1 Tax=Trichomonascus vanleenenianus TaxID=2268995 RepID=UPI003EC9D05D